MKTASSKSGFGIEREHDARGADVTAHHALDAGRQRDVGMVEALVHAIGYRAVSEQRGEDQPCIASSTLSMPRTLRKVSCWPANEASGKVLRRRRRAHGDGRIVVPGTPFRSQAAADVAMQVRRAGVARGSSRECRSPAAGERIDVIDIEIARGAALMR